jgi:hypothetical protein
MNDRICEAPPRERKVRNQLRSRRSICGFCGPGPSCMVKDCTNTCALTGGRLAAKNRRVEKNGSFMGKRSRYYY